MSRYVVRYGTMRSLGVMTARNELTYRRGMEVIVRSDRGIEVGQVLCEATEDALSHLDHPPAGSIVRAVSDDDAAEIDQIDAARNSKLATCQKHIDALKMQMKLVEVEQLFGGERLVVYYIADERVDFRELVRLLAAEFRTRIEMRQIGVRDEARVLADYGDCGKPVCCNNHLTTMPPVSMRMAKLQKATLDPTKISGRCGRLKCCLRYEYDNYDEIQKQLPRVGAFVVTRNGKAKVLAQRILTEQLLVESEDHRRMVIDASEVLSVMKASEVRAEKSDRSHDGKRSGHRRGKSNRSADAGPSNHQSVDVDESDSKQERLGADSPDANDRMSDSGGSSASDRQGGKKRGRPRRRRGNRDKKKPDSDV